MRSLLKNPVRPLVLTCAVVLGAGSALADIATYTGVLSGANEVPSVATAAGGVATLVVDTESLAATWTLEFSDLSSAQTAAHFHAAPAGVNGGVVFPLTLGTPASGMLAMTQPQLDTLAAGGIYVNVHSLTFPGGEIRGQMTLSGTVPADGVSFSAVKALFR